MTPAMDSSGTSPAPMEEAPMSPIDSILATIDSYIQDPAQVTPETLGQLRQEVELLKQDVEGGEDMPMQAPGDAFSSKLAGAMGG